MSRGQNRAAGQRAKLDQYWTKPALVEAILNLVPLHPQSRAIDLQAGGGAFVRGLKKRCAWAGAVDLDPTVPGLQVADEAWVADSRTWSPDFHLDWTAGNTPFADVPSYLGPAFALAQNHLYLAPLALQESGGRVDFWSSWRHTVRGYWVLAERAEFDRRAMSASAIGQQQGLFGPPPEDDGLEDDDGGGFNTALAVYWFDMAWNGPPEHFVPGWSWKTG